MFAPLNWLLSDRKPSLSGAVRKNLANFLGPQQLEVFSLHQQANSTVEQGNRTLCRNIISFMPTEAGNLDQHVALACYRYNTKICGSMGMSPYKAIFEVNSFDDWGELKVDEFDEAPDSLTSQASRPHKVLVINTLRARDRAANYYSTALKVVSYKVGDQMLLCNRELPTKSWNKVVWPG